MKKRVSFLVAVILIACTFFGSVVPVHAAEKQTDHIIAEGEPIDYDYAEANGYVGILTIFSCDSGQDSSLTYWGHSWVTFTNISGYSMQIGVLSVPSGQEITIGTRRGDSGHAGIWYNAEAYRYHNLGAYPNRVSLTIYITQSNVNTLNSIIASGDSWNAFNNNCATFASNVWNSISSTYLSPGTIHLPATLKSSIMAVSGYQTNRSMLNSTPVGYASGGSFVYGNTSLLSITETE